MKLNRPVPALLGFLAAPLVPALVLSIIYPSTEQLGGILLGALLAYFVSLAAAAIITLPMFLLLNALKMVRWWSAAATDGALGTAIVASLNPRQATPYFVYNISGGLAGLVFWVIWRFYEQDS